jgi:hypothetical protein
LTRSAGITVSAVAVFAGSALTLIYGAYWVRELQIASLGRSRLPFTKDSMLFMAVAALAAAAWGVVTSFGLLDRRQWARISVLVFAWLCIVYCLLPMLLFSVVPLSHIEGTSANFNFYVRLGATSYFALFVAAGGWLLYFFSKESVKDQFDGKPEGIDAQSPSELHSKRPLSISVVAWYLLITAFLFTATFSYRVPVSLFSYDIAGWEARLIKVIYVLVHVLAMVGLLELRRWGRTLAICYFSFLILDTLASVWIPGGRPVFERFIVMAPVSIGLKGLPFGLSSVVTIGLALLLFALPLWVVITQRQAFVRVT